MKNKIFRSMRLPLSVGLLSLFLTTSLLADLDLGFEVDIRIGKEVNVAPANQVDYKGPPPWAPAHGRRAKAVYHYYPEHQVYRNSSSGAWFYYRNGEWQAGVNLPLSIGVSSSSTFVSLSMETVRPYAYHEHVLKAYPKSHVMGSMTYQVSSHPSSGRKTGGLPPGLAKKGKAKGK